MVRSKLLSPPFEVDMTNINRMTNSGPVVGSVSKMLVILSAVIHYHVQYVFELGIYVLLWNLGNMLHVIDATMWSMCPLRCTAGYKLTLSLFQRSWNITDAEMRIPSKCDDEAAQIHLQDAWENCRPKLTMT